MAFDADFFVIGAGSGGVRAARIAAMNGARTIVAEESRIGGTCVIRGCVPKKLYVYASRFADDFADAEGFGWTVGATRLRLAEARGRQGKGGQPAVGRLPAQSRSLRRGAIEERSMIVDPHRVRLGKRPRTHGRAYSGRGRLPACRPGRSRGPRTHDHLERTLRPACVSAPPPGRWRRLYRGRVRGALPAARRRCDASAPRARTCCAASTTTCAPACATHSRARASRKNSASCRAASSGWPTARCASR